MAKRHTEIFLISRKLQKMLGDKNKPDWINDA